MKRLALLTLLLAVAACQPAPAPRFAVTPAVCRAEPDGSAPLAERGGGGTGMVAERGSGGTGALADRGSGGTGIIGIVTGFASVCIDGLEVGLNPRVPVDIDGNAGTTRDLRAGQVIAIAATNTGNAASAQRISVRHEVTGPIEAVEKVSPVLFTVAGQRVKVRASTVGAAHIQVGAWVSVSGLRDAEGDIVASRVDSAPPGRVLVHGPLLRLDGQSWIGGLTLRTNSDQPSLAGSFVTASGVYDRGVLRADTVTPDTLLTDPPAWFGPGTTTLIVQAHAHFGSGSITLAGGYRATVPNGAPPVSQDGLYVLHLTAQSGGKFGLTDALLSRPLPAGGLAASSARPPDAPAIPNGLAPMPPMGQPGIGQPGIGQPGIGPGPNPVPPTPPPLNQPTAILGAGAPLPSPGGAMPLPRMMPRIPPKLGGPPPR